MVVTGNVYQRRKEKKKVLRLINFTKTRKVIA